MNDAAELQLTPTSVTEISVIERAKLALASSNAETVLTELAKKYIDLATIKNKTDYSLVMGALGELRRHRVSIERTGKMARDDATKFSKAVIAEEKRLVGIIEPEENRLATVRRAWEDEQERIRKEAEEAEEARKEALRKKCLSFDYLVTLVTGRTSDEMQDVVDRLNATIITQAEFQDFTRQAEGSLIAAKDRAARLLAETLEHERQAAEARAAAAAEAAELARQREENERTAAELRARQEAIRKEQEEATAKAAQERAEIEKARKEAAAELARINAMIEAQAAFARINAEIERKQQEAAAEGRLREEQARQVIEAAAAEAAAAEAAEAAEAEAAAAEAAEAATAPRPTLAEDLEAWKVKHKVSKHTFDDLLAILASHQV
jgi:nucleotide-binding universal stress UspA family protein